MSSKRIAIGEELLLRLLSTSQFEAASWQSVIRLFLRLVGLLCLSILHYHYTSETPMDFIRMVGCPNWWGQRSKVRKQGIFLACRSRRRPEKQTFSWLELHGPHAARWLSVIPPTLLLDDSSSPIVSRRTYMKSIIWNKNGKSVVGLAPHFVSTSSFPTWNDKYFGAKVPMIWCCDQARRR